MLIKTRHDYAGTAALAGNRRFEFTSCNSTAVQSTRPLRYQPPLNVPKFTLPKNYTLYDDIMIILESLGNATLLFRDPAHVKSKLQQELNTFANQLNDDLTRILAPIPRCTTPFRRFLIEDSFRLAALIYISAMSKGFPNWGAGCEKVLELVTSELLDNTSDWSHTVQMIFHLLVTGGKTHSQENIYYVLQLMDIFVTLDWDACKTIRDRLQDYLLYAKICAGKYQDLWLCRVDIVGN